MMLPTLLHDPCRAFVAAIILYGVVFGLMAALAGAPVPLQPVGLLMTSVASLIATGPLIYTFARLRLESMSALAGMGGALIVALLIDLLAVQAGQPFLVSLAVLAAALLLGALLDRFVFWEPELVLLLALLYIVVDIFSVYFGPTGAIVQRGGPLLSILSVPFPIVGRGTILPLIGIMDFAVWTACLRAAHRFGFNYNASFGAMALGLLVTAFAGIVFLEPMPALPLMMAGFVLVNRRHLNFRQRELWGMGGIALIIVIGIGAALRWLLLR